MRKGADWRLTSMFCLAAFSSPQCFAAQGEEHGSGEIDQVEASLSRGKIINPGFAIDIPTIKVSITATGEVSDGVLWLGCSYRDGGRVRDLRVKKVRSGPNGRKRAFRERFTAAVPGVKKASDGKIELVENHQVPCTVSLWRRLVVRTKCAAARNGRSCDDCRKNGYHMEGRVDSKSPLATFPMITH